MKSRSFKKKKKKDFAATVDNFPDVILDAIGLPIEQNNVPKSSRNVPEKEG